MFAVASLKHTIYIFLEKQSRHFFPVPIFWVKIGPIHVNIQPVYSKTEMVSFPINENGEISYYRVYDATGKWRLIKRNFLQTYNLCCGDIFNFMEISQITKILEEVILHRRNV